jgi:hypothetical protein
MKVQMAKEEGPPKNKTAVSPHPVSHPLVLTEAGLAGRGGGRRGKRTLIRSYEKTQRQKNKPER